MLAEARRDLLLCDAGLPAGRRAERRDWTGPSLGAGAPGRRGLYCGLVGGQPFET
jgi:hypothetical protein